MLNIVKTDSARISSFILNSIFLLFLLLVGCQKNQQATVTGSVTLDGDLLDHGTVFFLAGSKNEAEAAAGGIQADGTYRVQIGQSGNLWSGEYAVEVTASEPSIPHPQGGPPTPGALITPERYANTNTSGLRYNIRAGENIIDIALVSDDPTMETPEDPDVTTNSDTLTETPSSNQDLDTNLNESLEETGDPTE